MFKRQVYIVQQYPQLKSITAVEKIVNIFQSARKLRKIEAGRMEKSFLNP